MTFLSASRQRFSVSSCTFGRSTEKCVLTVVSFRNIRVDSRPAIYIIIFIRYIYCRTHSYRACAMSQNRNSRCARNRRLPYGRTLCLAPYSLIRIGIRHIRCIGKSSPVR